MSLRVGGQASRPLSLLVQLLLLSSLLLSLLSATTTSAYPSIQRLSVAMAASTKPITVVTGANKGIGCVRNLGNKSIGWLILWAHRSIESFDLNSPNPTEPPHQQCPLKPAVPL